MEAEGMMYVWWIIAVVLFGLGAFVEPPEEVTAHRGRYKIGSALIVFAAICILIGLLADP
jgi:hypothetical protein